jgi:uncharacterized protein YecE (DUF72 family)
MRGSPKRHTLVGTCGFAERQARTFADFRILEVQRTFYQPPKVATAEGWRARAGEDFVFTVKAWQLITHPASSPTYRRLTEDLSAQALAEAGDFRCNGLTRMAWERTRAIAKALGARAVLFQMPKRFAPSTENLRRMSRFMESLDRGRLRLLFEPRGEAWDDATVRAVVADLDLVHVVDPFLRRPVGRGLRYYRLHGRPAYHYHYRYTDQDQAELEHALSRAWPNWVLFNNDHMAEDARRFIQRLGNLPNRTPACAP